MAAPFDIYSLDTWYCYIRSLYSQKRLCFKFRIPIMADIDGSEDVNDFLQRIRELGDKRDKEDEERTRKLEEDIMQGRRERQARRAGLCVLVGYEPALTYTIA